jgi:acyl carrier protein
MGAWPHDQGAGEAAADNLRIDNRLKGTRNMATITAEQVEARVVETLASFGPDADQISRESTFEELDIDSLDLVELAQVVEDDYGVVLKGEDMKELKTVGDAVDLIVSRAE